MLKKLLFILIAGIVASISFVIYMDYTKFNEDNYLIKAYKLIIEIISQISIFFNSYDRIWEKKANSSFPTQKEGKSQNALA